MAADEARALSMRVQALREQRADISRQIAQSHNAADRRKQNERRRPKTFGITEYQERLVSAIWVQISPSSSQVHALTNQGS